MINMEIKLVYVCPECGEEFKQGDWDYNYDTSYLDFECPNCGWFGNESEVLIEEVED